MMDEDGAFAVKLARNAIERWLSGHERILPKNLPEAFSKKQGAFVSIHTHPENRLRGCIGYVQPDFNLADVIREAAIGATRDPRFPPLGRDELDRIVIEVSILTPPELISASSPSEYPKKIRIGKHGLIVNCGGCTGLLLPQVAVEFGLNEKEFLGQTCKKAGLDADAWKRPEARICRFSSEVFYETKPCGSIMRKGSPGTA